MPIYLHNFGPEKPDADLAKLMLDKVRVYHAGSGAELVHEHRHIRSDGTPAEGSVLEWLVRDPRDTKFGTVNELMVESARSMCEGLYEGWMLGTKPARDKARAAAEKRAERKRQNAQVASLSDPVVESGEPPRYGVDWTLRNTSKVKK